MTFMTEVTITMMSMTTRMQVARRTLRTIKWGRMVNQILECPRNWKSAWVANSITTRTARMIWRVRRTWRLDIATSWMKRRELRKLQTRKMKRNDCSRKNKGNAKSTDREFQKDNKFY